MKLPETLPELRKIGRPKYAFLTAAKNLVVDQAEFDDDEVAAGHKSTLECVRLGRHMEYDGAEVSIALSEKHGHVPKESMIDFPSLHAGIITRRDGTGIDLTPQMADEIAEACDGKFMIPTLAYFDNCLHHDPTIRKQIKQHTLRVGRAACLLRDRGLGTQGIAGFIGRDETLGLQENFGVVGKRFHGDILSPLGDMGLKFYAENCHMQGWNPSEHTFKNLACTPALMIALRQMADAKNLGQWLRAHYDVSHCLSLGSNQTGTLSTYEAAGYRDMVETAHLKDMIRNLLAVMMHTMRGQQTNLASEGKDGEVHRMIADDGTVTKDAKVKLAAWSRYVGEHSHCGIGYWNLLAMLQGHQADWVQHQIDLRQKTDCPIDDYWVIVEHELQRGMRDCPIEVMIQLLHLVLTALKGADQLADVYAQAPAFASEAGFELPGYPNPMLAAPGLGAAVQEFMGQTTL